MVIIVPALAKAQQGDPEAVPRTVSGLEPPRPPHVCGGIYQPGPMQANYCAQEDSPGQIRKSTRGKQHDSENCNWNPVPLANPDVEFVLAKIGNIGKKLRGIILQHLPGDDPAHVGPEAAVTGRVRIAFLIRILVMDSMCCDPEDWPPFQR